MIIETFPQRSEEWYAAKAGVPSASNFDKIVTMAGQRSKQADKYLYQLAGEKVLGKIEDGYCNAAMTRGIELEPEARSFFEMLHDVEVQEVGMCYRDEQKLFSCSPDGLMENAGLEIKCPQLSTHIEYLLNNALPATYFQQVQGSLYVTGLSHWFFMSYYPGIKPLIVKVEPDLKFHAKLEAALEQFCNELDKVTNKLR
jgi:putative phage-type endonuclease